MSRISGFDEVEKQIREHPGSIAHYEILDLERLFQGILKVNRNAIVRHIRAPSEDDNISFELMQSVRPSDFSERYTVELLRLLYNFLSAFCSVIDISRRLSKKHDRAEIDEYLKILDGLKLRGDNRFLHDLRNYVLHYGIPPLGWTIKLKASTPNSCNYFISKDKLLLWDGWSPEAEVYINDGDIDLLVVIEEHANDFDKVTALLLQQTRVAHQTEIDQVNKLICKRNAILSGAKIT